MGSRLLQIQHPWITMTWLKENIRITRELLPDMYWSLDIILNFPGGAVL